MDLHADKKQIYQIIQHEISSLEKEKEETRLMRKLEIENKYI